MEVTEEYEFYTPFKMLFISLSLGAPSTSNFTHSYNSPPNSSCFSSGLLRSHFGLCSLPVQLVQRLETVTGWRTFQTLLPHRVHTHTHAVQASGMRWKQLDTSLYIYLKK